MNIVQLKPIATELAIQIDIFFLSSFSLKILVATNLTSNFTHFFERQSCLADSHSLILAKVTVPPVSSSYAREWQEFK